MNDLEKYLDIDYSKLPRVFASAVKQYIEKGLFPGAFLQALVCNDLSRTVYLAHSRFTELVLLVRFFQNKAPAACWGSSEAMELWKARRGIRG